MFVENPFIMGEKLFWISLDIWFRVCYNIVDNRTQEARSGRVFGRREEGQVAHFFLLSDYIIGLVLL